LFVTCVFAVEAGAAQGDCGQPATGGAEPTATDCLFILQASVGGATCDPECVCDTSGDGSVTATDALVCLDGVVGGTPLDACPCGGVTTTTIHTGFGDVINESCVVCHGDGRIVDVAVMHPGLQTLADVNASIDSVTIDVDDMAMTAVLTVNFTVTDPDGNYIPELGAESTSRPGRFAYLRFAASQLLPAGMGTGDPDTWLRYTSSDRDPANLTDNGDGTYVYVFGTDLYDLYVPTHRNRVLLMIFGDIVEQAKNVTYDFVPDQLPGPFTFDTSRDVVTTAACNDCHERLGSPLGHASFHGGSRYLTEACATRPGRPGGFHGGHLSAGSAQLRQVSRRCRRCQLEHATFDHGLRLLSRGGQLRDGREPPRRCAGRQHRMCVLSPLRGHSGVSPDRERHAEQPGGSGGIGQLRVRYRRGHGQRQ
jgi:hypothetical protein